MYDVAICNASSSRKFLPLIQPRSHGADCGSNKGNEDVALGEGQSVLDSSPPSQACSCCFTMPSGEDLQEAHGDEEAQEEAHVHHLQERGTQRSPQCQWQALHHQVEGDQAVHGLPLPRRADRPIDIDRDAAPLIGDLHRCSWFAES